MDFQTLHPLLPKLPQTWSTQETTIWLNYIALPQLIPKFKNASIDGSCIYLLDSDILKEELGIQSAIVRKKVMNWVTFGLKNYEQFINSSFKMVQQIKICEKEPLQLKKSITQCIRSETKPHLSHSQTFQSCRKDECFLTLQQFEGSNLGFHIVKNQPLTIGSHKNNQIMSLETSISEKHAIIGKRQEVNNGRYFIQDLGSKFGTYIKINQRMALKNGMILEIGSYQFAVSNIDPQKQSLKLKLTSYSQIDSDSENIDSSNSTSIAKNKNITLQIDLQTKTKYTFGRRKQNDFQKDDKHMSGMHCKITFISGKFYIEDYESTNGTWIRISPEFTISKQIDLENQSIVKLGTAISYICRINNSVGNKKEEDGEMIDQNLCKLCRNLENNCLFLPCSHNISCMQCCEKIGRFCPECNFEIDQKIKIHK